MSGKHLNDISKVYLDTIANVKKAETDADIKRWEDLGGPTPGNYRADDNSAKLKEGRRLRKSDWRQDLKEVIDKPETEEKAEKKVDEKKGIKNKIVINPTFKEAIQEIGGELLEVNAVDSVEKTQQDTQKRQEAHKKQLEAKQKKVAAMKKLVLKKKMQAVGAGGGEDITAGYEPEGEVIAEKDLNAAERRALPDKDFALPGKGEGPEGKQRGAYPINDKKHARAALAMAAAHASPEKEAKVKAAVKKKYPGIEVSEGKGVGTVVKQLGRIAAKKLQSKKVKKAIYKTVKKIGGAGVEGAVDAATDRAREEGGRIVRDAGKKKEVKEAAPLVAMAGKAALSGVAYAAGEAGVKKVLKSKEKKKEVDEGVLQMVKSIGRKKKPEKKAEKATDAGARARRKLQQKDHETVNFLPMNEGKKKGLWDNIHAKRKRGEKPAKPGDKDYPKTLNVEGLEKARKNVGADKCWDGYKAKGTKKKGGKEVPNCVKEEDKAFNYVVAKLKKQHGDGVLTKGDKMPQPSAAQKKKNAEIRAKRAKEDGRDATEKASDGRYSDRYSNRGSD